MRVLAPARLLALLVGTAAAALPGLPDPLAAGWQGKPVCEKLHEDQLQRILRCTFPPGVGHERHYHSAHFGYALAGGQVRITDQGGTRDVTFETGSTSVSRGIAWHEIVNIGESTIVYLLVEPKPPSAQAGR